MSDWTNGYVADIGYTFGYYPELNPLRVKLAFLNAGIKPPEITNACELGFGQGLGVALHAAASITSWCGTDFNPSQAGFAQELGRVSDSSARLYDEAFDDFCARADLPEFDYIGLHGIWSWISDENRAVIVDFVRRKLKVGGVLYISYNTQPGWAAMVPMRDLLTQHADIMGSSGTGIISRIDGALEFAESLLAVNPKFAAANPQIAVRIKHIKEQNRHYVAHEYFNRDWQPMSFAKMADWLEAAKLNWVCSAAYLEAIDAVNLSADQQALLRNISEGNFRQTVRDFCTNQTFRRDYWVKGARQLTALEQTESLREQRVILTKFRSEVSLTHGSENEITLQEAIYLPILDLLANQAVWTIGELEAALHASEKGKGIPFELLTQAIVVLCGTEALAPAQEEQAIASARTRTDRLNQHLMAKSRSNADLSYLASPVTGGGVAVTRFEQLFLLANASGRTQPNEWAQYAWDVIREQGQRITKDGSTLEGTEENVRELADRATEFAEKRFVLLRALQVI